MPYFDAKSIKLGRFLSKQVHLFHQIIRSPIRKKAENPLLFIADFVEIILYGQRFPIN